MKRIIQSIRRAAGRFGGLLSLALSVSAAHAGPAGSDFTARTNVSELRDAVTREGGRTRVYDLTGTVLASDANTGTIFFRDESGTAAIELDLNKTALQAGQRIRLRGTNYVTATDMGLSLGAAPVVNADYLHPTMERSGEIYLKAGLHPIRVPWFNRTSDYFLRVEYSGPNLVRQTIPNSMLFHAATDAIGGNLLPGLSYRDFEGQWEKVPNFAALMPQAIGVISNFDLSVKSRDENVGLEFTGFLKIPADGIYQFYLNSDDGSQLFLDGPPSIITTLGTVPVPAPQPVEVSQGLPDGQDCLWAETEGIINFIGRNNGNVEFELGSGEKKLQVKMLSASPEIASYLLNSRVQVRGICPVIKNSAGQKFAGAMVATDWRDVQVLDVAPGQWSALKKTTIGELSRRFPSDGSGIARLQGRLRFDTATRSLYFEDATGSAPIQLLTKLPAKAGENVECLAQWRRDGSRVYLHKAVAREAVNEAAGKTNTLQVLTTAMQVQRLTRAEAEREYPVTIRGVITSVSDEHRDFIIQDSTRAVFVLVGDIMLSHFPRVGDYCEITGVSRPADFSPIVGLRTAKILWRGQLPPPLHPTHDQLIGGSLDAQYVEVRGLVIATSAEVLTLLMADGVLDFKVVPAPNGEWATYLNSIIRIRGCLFANWDPNTHRVILDQPLHLQDATASVDSPPPLDMFEADKVGAKDLMQFDARFDTFRRVKIAGQVIHPGPDINYLMDGATGLRFQLAQPAKFAAGDKVEVVGLVEVGGVSPALRQAIARKTGYAPLPEPRHLLLNLISNDCDSTLVSMTGTLVGLQNQRDECVLEMQVGVKNFVARLDAKQKNDTLWPIGSRLNLTGTFCALDGGLPGRDVSSFELLLNSARDVQVIALPPWWTLSRLLVALACLVLGLAIAFIWIALLRHQVERRTRQLAREIGERERAEKMRAIEQERSRIARDLHDDLGSTLTEISMMATAHPGLKMESEITARRLQEIAEKSRSMVSALDGVVWVVNSKNDTLASLIEYLASYTEEFLAKAQIACRVELPKTYPEQIIAAEIRHDVMLAVREVLNNAVRHGRPGEVILRLAIVRNGLEITIQDNGCGFDPEQVNGNGLTNLQQRMGKLNGSCQIVRSPGGGATVMLKLALPG
ncbi:MAG TPA: ATP-binding protein [Verrucomicrobiae bacterium]|jgi:signal transduction histidine kinase